MPVPAADRAPSTLRVMGVMHVMNSCVVAGRVRSCAALSRVRFQFTSGRGGRAGQPQPGRPPGMGQAAQGVPNVLDAVLAMY